jgi:hypothetical protein
MHKLNAGLVQESHKANKNTALKTKKKQHSTNHLTETIGLCCCPLNAHRRLLALIVTTRSAPRVPAGRFTSRKTSSIVWYHDPHGVAQLTEPDFSSKLDILLGMSPEIIVALKR